jgi:hypothetical protein
VAIRDIERSRRNLQVVIADALTPADAVRIRELARQQRPATRVTVDVRSARSCPAHALLMLCSIRSRAGLPLAFVGLSAANQRLLQYFGLEPSSPRGVEQGQADLD